MTKEVIQTFEAGQRLDKTLAKLYPEYSRSSIERLIVSGDITVNNTVVKTKYLLKADDTISIDFSELEKAPEKIELPIIYEDSDVVVVNKPIGVLAHTKGAFSKEGTVAGWLRDREAGKSGDLDHFWASNRAGIVHRLDRATSGIMILAKNPAAQNHLGKQFSSRNVKKTYIAVISGMLPESEGLIDIPIERNPKKPATFRAGVNGKVAQTHFKTLRTAHSSGKEYSLIELKPITGRTHQLRVHLNYLQHPIVGDEFYGGEKADRLMLHAQQLEITLPGGVRKTFSAPTPPELAEFM